MTAIQRRQIRFHERVQFKTIRHVSEFSDEEIKNGWYDKDDFNRMSDNVSDIAKLIGDGETTQDGEELCTRGLEHIVEEELADYRAEKMINSIDAVLDEQEEQWDEGKEEPGLIAELYAEYAKPLLREAHLIGLKDAEDGFKTWDDLLEEEEYKKLVKRPAPSCSVVKTAAKSKKPKRRSFEEKSTKKPLSSASMGKTETAGSVKTTVKKNKVKKSFSLSSKDSSKTKGKKSKEKPARTQSYSPADSEEFESSSSLHSSTSSQTSLTSSRRLKKEGSVSSINSCTLRDLSLRSISEEFDAISDTEKKSEDKKQFLSLKRNGEATARKNNQKKQKPRRSTMDRKYGKYGTEMSPFVFRRDGTLTFRKPDVEKLKREQKQKRKSAIHGSLTKYAFDDDDEDDILAGILCGRSNKSLSTHTR